MSLIGLPKRMVRALIHSVTGGGQVPPPPPRPADEWERRGLHSEAFSTPPAAGAAVEHSHQHGHSHASASVNPSPAAFAIRVVDTPNPEARKFETNRTLVDGRRTRSIHSTFDARGDALGEALFAIEGVVGLYAKGAAVTVLKSEAASWDTLSGSIESALAGLVRVHAGGAPGSSV